MLRYSRARRAVEQLRLFQPILVGATLHERLIGCVGALLGIALTGLVCGWFFGATGFSPLIVAPMGASAVLLFAVPASPMAQPWPIIGGNTISALAGVAVAQVVHQPVLAIGLGVALAIAAMSFTRSLHPPGGAAALTAIVGGPAVASAGFAFPFFPVALNAIILVMLGTAFHALAGRGYPHAPVVAPANPHGTRDVSPARRVGVAPGDVDAALATFGETLDIDRADLDRLLHEVEQQALVRAHGTMTCAQVMSHDVITVSVDAGLDQARNLLLAHDIWTLPAVDAAGRLAGTLGLRELAAHPSGTVGAVLTAARTAAPDDPAVNLVPLLTDGRTHAIVVTAADRTILGLITQTDLLATLARAAITDLVA